MGSSLRWRIATSFGGASALMCLVLTLALTSFNVVLAIALAILGGVIGLAFGWFVANRITAPIASLTRALQQEASGQTAAPVMLPPGAELAQLVSTFEQMATAMRKEARLAADQRDTLAAVLTTMSDGVAVLGPNGHVRLANPALRQLLDYPGATPNDHPFFELAPNHQIVALADQALQGNNGEVTVELASGRRVLRVLAAPLHSHEGGALLVVHDLTELHRQELVRQEFIANASHELLTPIGTVRALTDVLLHGGMDNRKTARRFLKSLQTEADRLTALGRDLIDLAQADSGELRLSLVPTDIHAVLAIVIDRLHTKATRAAVTFEAPSLDNLPFVLADASRLEQVLVNLLDNAIKFSPPESTVAISTQATTGAVTLRVADNGAGISAEDQTKIFDRFYKVRLNRPGAPGTGLGLAIASRFVHAMHGTITVESELGHGSTFTVTLPRADTPRPADLVPINA